MFEFPTTVDRHRGLARAQARLRYMLYFAALETVGRPSIRALARNADVNHAAVFQAIERGQFTENMAKLIERAVGRTRLPHEYLLTPLDVGREVINP